MNSSFFIAAVLSVAMAFAHSFMGERYFLNRLLKRSAEEDFGSDLYANRTIRVAWHFTAVSWGTAGILLAIFSWEPSNPSIILVSKLIAGWFFVNGLISLIGSRGRHLSWLIFFGITAIILLGI